MSQNSINKRILSEIEALKTDDDIKKYLKEILMIELDNIDQGKPQYVEQYKQKMDEIF